MDRQRRVILKGLSILAAWFGLPGRKEAHTLSNTSPFPSIADLLFETRKGFAQCSRNKYMSFVMPQLRVVFQKLHDNIPNLALINLIRNAGTIAIDSVTIQNLGHAGYKAETIRLSLGRLIIAFVVQPVSGFENIGTNAACQQKQN